MRGRSSESALIVLMLCGTIACGGGKAGSNDHEESDGRAPLPLIVSIVGAPEPEQIFDGNAMNPNFGVEAVDLPSGTTVQLKVELIEADGDRRDVTNREELAVSSTFHKVHECGKRALCIWPRPGSEPSGEPPSLPYGRARVEAEYISDDGLKAYGGFYVDVQESGQ